MSLVQIWGLSVSMRLGTLESTRKLVHGKIGLKLSNSTIARLLLFSTIPAAPTGWTQRNHPEPC
jgi:hypothetical protein